MHATYQSLPFNKNFFCYEALSPKEANVLLLWGSFTQKLADVAGDIAQTMMTNRYVIHMKGCQSFNNEAFFLNMSVDKTILDCAQEKLQCRTIITEARQCLRA